MVARVFKTTPADRATGVRTDDELCVSVHGAAAAAGAHAFQLLLHVKILQNTCSDRTCCICTQLRARVLIPAACSAVP